MEKMFDISHHQGDLIDFDGAKLDGFEVVICRASHGYWKDSTFLPNVSKALKADLIVGAYHYVYIAHGLQVAPLVHQLRDAEKVHTPAYIDVEEYDNQGYTTSDWQRILDQNVGYLLNEGFKVGIYTSAYMWEKLTKNIKTIAGIPAENFSLWVADWRDVSSPILPPPWKEWDFWQKGSNIRPAWNKNTYDNRTDWGVTYLPLDELREKYLGSEPEPPQPPDPTQAERLRAEAESLRRSADNLESIANQL